jgi:hypothetical protein
MKTGVAENCVIPVFSMQQVRQLQKYIGNPAIYNILITVINGGVQMVIYFPIYKIIFPEGEKQKC